MLPSSTHKINKHTFVSIPLNGPFIFRDLPTLTLTQNQCSAKSEIFAFLETSDKFSRSHVI